MKDRHSFAFFKKKIKIRKQSSISCQIILRHIQNMYQIENNEEIKYSLISVLGVSAAAGGLGSFLMSVLASAVLSFDDFFSSLSSSDEDELESSVKASLIAEKSSASGALFPSVKT